MSGPSKKWSRSSDEPEDVRVRAERLRQEADAFQRTVEEEIRTTWALIHELPVRQAKRRRH
jgi:hypothetical protein